MTNVNQQVLWNSDWGDKCSSYPSQEAVFLAVRLLTYRQKNQVSFGQFEMVQKKCSEILVIIDVHIKPELFRPQPSEVAIIVIIVDTILLSDLPYSL